MPGPTDSDSVRGPMPIGLTILAIGFLVILFLSLELVVESTKQLQQFVKSTWHPSNLAKQEKIVSNSLANQLGKNKTWQNSPLRAYICAHGSWFAIIVSL
jgi:hypothetical protein